MPNIKHNEINPLLLINKIVFNDISVKLNRVEKNVLLSLVNHNNWKTGVCNPSIKTIQNEWFYHNDREVIKALKSLNDKKVFTKETIKRKNYYYLNFSMLLNNSQNDGNLQNDGNNNRQNDCDNNCQNDGTNNEITMKEQLNIYSDLDNEDYVNKINKELEEDLFNRIKSNYDPGAIKKELDNLKDKGLSKLDLLNELENNLKIKSIETKEEKSKDVEEIFNYWNNKKIIKHKEITPIIKKEIIKILKKYSAEEVKQAIDLYSEILKSEFYFSYKWSLGDFLKRNNGISTFMEEGSNKANYEEWKSKNKLNNDTKIDFDDERYII